MSSKLKSTQRILIVGDAGRGKTTLAQRLSQKLGIPYHSTDDYFWITKFSKKQDPQTSINEITKAYAGEQWIIEGTTQHLIKPGLKKAELIIHLKFKSVWSQWWQIIKRHKTRDNEPLLEMLKLLRHVFYKRYSLGYEKSKVTVAGLVKPFKDKLMVLHSHQEIDKFIKDL